MKILSYIKSLFVKPEVREFGITKQDLKNLAPSENVFEQKEVVASINAPTFNGVNNDGTIRKFPYQYQDGSKQCVAFTTAKIAMVLYYLLKGKIVKFSPAFFYKQRINQGTGGMNFDDIVKIANKTGCLVSDFLQSEGISEESVNALKLEKFMFETADAFKLPENWIQPDLDFDTIASTIEATKKPLMIWATFGAGEFFFTSKPVKNNSTRPWAHSFTVIDTTRYNGENVLVVEDSADYEANYQKFITKDWFKNRVILCRYPINFKLAIPEDTKPIYTGSIISLQDILKYEQCMPSNIPSTGYFGNLTKLGLIEFQKKHNIEPSVGFFGEKTKLYLSSNYK